MNTERNVVEEVESFSARSFQTNNVNFGYGVFESVLIQALSDLPKKKREVYLDRLKQIDSKFFVMEK